MQKIRKKFGRVLALLLSIMMLIGALPLGTLTAFAAEHDNQVFVVVENTTFTDASAPWTGVLVEEWVELKSDSTMMSCVVDALSANGYTQRGAESNYISEINGLAAFDGGSMSGWMGTLNDWFTNEGFGAFTVANEKLTAGDEIRIMYTTVGYGEDLGGSWGNNDKTVKALAFSEGELSPAFSKNTHEYTLTIPKSVSSLIITPTASNKNYQVRASVDGVEYKRTEKVPVSDGTVITVKCGDPSWPSMNSGGEAQVYTVTVRQAEAAPEALTLSLRFPTVAYGITNYITATNADGESVKCTWSPADESLFRVASNWNQTDADGNIIGKSEISLNSLATAENVTITATSIENPAVKGSITFDIVPMAELYAVADGKIIDKLEIKNITKTFLGCELPPNVEEVLLRPADGYGLSFGNSTWKPVFNDDGFCNINQMVGSMPDTAFIPERLVFNKELLPLYPSDTWQVSRINIGTTGNIWLFWEKTGKLADDIKTENAVLYTPVASNSSIFNMLLDRNADTASFLFQSDALKAYITDSDYKVKETELTQENGYFVLPVKASELEKSQYIVPSKTYYVLVENAEGPNTKFKVTAYQRNNEMQTPSAVVDYLCLASQYTNNSNNAFGDYGIMPERTLIGKPQAGTGELVSLGNFGGYITYRFDDLIYNDPNNPYGIDFVVNGNTMGGAGFSEPANVLVSQDGKTWYTLAGSDHYSNNAIWNYTMTYTKNGKAKAEWTDSLGGSGVSYNYPLKSDYPLFDWSEDNESKMTVSGTLLVAEGTDPYGSKTAAFPNWGYVDTGYSGLNPYIGGQAGEVFDLSWAVDENGQPVKLDWVKYVKVQTASNVDAGSIGEKSTEVSAIYKADAAEAAVGVTAAPTSITVNGVALNLKAGVSVYEAVAENAVDVAVEASENANVYINSTYGGTAHFDSLNHRMVRVIVQEGEKEPVIYYINLKTQTQVDQEAAAAVISLIDAVGDVTIASKDALASARTAYDALTEEQKALVTNYSVLVEAEEAYAELVKTANERFETIYKSVGDYIESLGIPDVGSVGGEWMVIGLARSGRKVPDGYYENVVKYVQEYINSKEQLHRAKSTDNARVILALTALGYDVTNVGGHNLLAGLTDMSYIKKQGINGPIWALIAFDSHHYEIPAGNVTRDALIAAILNEQLADGGWALSGSSADPDMTAMAIQALAPYYQTNTAVKTAVDSALNRLSAMQTPTGGYQSWGTLNSESCAQVIVALTALGIDPHTDARFIKNGCSALDALTAFYTDGGFRHTMDGELNGMATEQGYYALAAFARLKSGSISLYDMSDVAIADDIHQTGDTSDTVVCAVLMLISLAGLAFAAGRKRGEKQE